jgi:dTDP-6-deoxy-L-talose 4-dehydrogenase (NAD+)
MTKNILLTGATGFVGKQVTGALSKADVYLRLVVRKGKGRVVEGKGSSFEIIETENLFSEDSKWWAEQCKGIDTIIHLAWYAEPGKYLYSDFNIDCLQGSLNLAQGAIKAGVRRFIGIGTCFEYDLKNGILSIETPLKPTSPYAAAKAALYFNLSQWLPLNKIEFAWCRLFYLYGEGEDKRRFVPYLRSKLANGEPAELTSGKQIRDYLDVYKAGQMIAEVALSNQLGPINICSGIPITIRQLAEQIADEYGRKDLLFFGSRPDNLVDPPCVVGILSI